VAKTAPSEQWRVARELRARVKMELDAAGIVTNPWANIFGPGAGADDPGAEPPG